jgi:hypothetical protein
MKPFLLVVIFVVFNILAVLGQNTCEEDECFTATIDGNTFIFRDKLPLNAMMVKQPGSLDGRMPERTLITISLTGNSYEAVDGHWFTDNIQFEINYTGQLSGEPRLYTISLQYNSTVYSCIKGGGQLKITRLDWQPDQRGFKLTAEFDCTMRSWGHPEDGKKDINLKGMLSNISINIPPWLIAKN